MEASVTAAIADPSYTDRKIVYNPVARLLREADYRNLRERAVACTVPGFAIGWHGHCQDNPLVAVFDEGTGELAGGLEHKNVFVRPQYRGRGLGAEILIVAFENALRHPDEMNSHNTLTTAGRANRVAAHRIAVERAFENGLEVPPEVLDDYPHLTAARMAFG